jgi:amine acid ABC transporter, permease protein, 3-TM region, His/Glu/Gln/Arg/opine family
MRIPFDAASVFAAAPAIIGALPTTLWLTALSLLAGAPLGVLLAGARLSRRPAARGLSACLVSYLRGTPPIVQLFLSFYGLPLLLRQAGIELGSWPKAAFAVAAFALNSAGFLSEIIRASYLAVDPGQREAALSVGLSPLQSLRRIVGPQAAWIALPNFGNSLIGLLKETSLAYSIGVIELTGQAQIVAARGYGARQFEILLGLALVYWAICLGLERLLALAETSLGKGRRSLSERGAPA